MKFKLQDREEDGPRGRQENYGKNSMTLFLINYDYRTDIPVDGGLYTLAAPRQIRPRGDRHDPIAELSG